jgi:hypothetical protein
MPMTGERARCGKLIATETEKWHKGHRVRRHINQLTGRLPEN